MIHTRMSGRRLTAAAVTAVLAVTAGTLAAPATAAPVAATASDQDQQETSVSFPLGAEVVSAGTTGFMSRTNGATPEYRWTRYADGTSTVLPGAALVTGGVSDFVVTGEAAEPMDNRVVTIHDMSAPTAAPVEVDLDRLGAHYTFAGAIGSTLIVMVDKEEGSWQPHLVTVDGGSLTDRPVTGMPAEICELNVAAYTTGTALFDCGLGMNEARSKAVVDLATAAVVSTHAQGGVQYRMTEAAVSGTHVAWHESDGATSWIGAARRGSAESRRVDATGYFSDTFQLLGGWLTYGEPRAIEESWGRYAGVHPRPPRPFTAQSVDTGETVELLTHFSSAVPTPDGSLMVRGGTLDKGEGLYRVSLGEGGKQPVTELVAPTGQATAVTLLGTAVPSVITGNQLTKGIDLSWDLSRGDAYVWVTLVHVRTGERLQWPVVTEGGTAAPRTISWHWNGTDLTASYSTSAAPNGEYTWEITAVPNEGIGPELRASGRFAVTRPVAPHDYNDNGTPDVFARDTGGTLWRIDTNRTPTGDGVRRADLREVGSGWGGYDQIEAVGNIAGAAHADIVARDKSGVLWHYLGKGDGTLAGRYKIGAGWGGYNKITGGSDLNSDGKPDLLAVDAAGAAWLYKGTGSWRAPFTTRVKLGTGWHGYNQITATGNIAGAPAGDLVGRDKSGVLWLHLGKGDGTFAPRIKIGSGWGGYTHMVGTGDGNGDGRPDLLVFEAGLHGQSYFYPGTGDWRAPFKARVHSDVITDGQQYDAGF
ncbi:VCBS repeat-containing protein [Streptomyces sp. NPDC046712]|uniref:FG-GAP repeat domain-containing protein n=1 Tax=Streptomyces sp. NPDC046712 TaxID=3154802 RepID=UPI0033C73AA8